MEATIFIGTVIIAITQVVKYLVPNVHGVYTILVAALVGIVVGMIDQFIGVTDITIAEGLMIGLGSAGVVYTASRPGTASEPSVRL